jgi:WD40 repeat protein
LGRQGRDGFVRIWSSSDTVFKKPLRSIDTLSYSFCRCAVHEDTAATPASSRLRLLFSSSEESSTISVWDLSSETVLRKIQCDAAGTRVYGMCMTLKVCALPPPKLVPLRAPGASAAAASSGQQESKTAPAASAEAKAAGASSSAGDSKSSAGSASAASKPVSLLTLALKQRPPPPLSQGPASSSSGPAAAIAGRHDLVVACGHESGHVGFWSVATGKLLAAEQIHKEPGA